MDPRPLQALTCSACSDYYVNRALVSVVCRRCRLVSMHVQLEMDKGRWVSCCEMTGDVRGTAWVVRMPSVWRRSTVIALCAVCAVTLWYREHWVLGVTNHTHVGYMRER